MTADASMEWTGSSCRTAALGPTSTLDPTLFHSVPSPLVCQLDIFADDEDDVMAHVHTFGTVAPEAAGIIQ